MSHSGGVSAVESEWTALLGRASLLSEHRHRHEFSLFRRDDDVDGSISLGSDTEERLLPIRPPLQKLDRLKDIQAVVLLMDDEGYVVEIATPDVLPAP